MTRGYGKELICILFLNFILVSITLLDIFTGDFPRNILPPPRVRFLEV